MYSKLMKDDEWTRSESLALCYQSLSLLVQIEKQEEED